MVQTEHRVRIAREIPEGGCLWREVLAHERRHVAVNRRSLREAAAAARAAAAAWAARAEGHGATLEEAMAGLRTGLRQAIEPALAAMRSGRATAHGAIDTQAEYERLGRTCPADQQRLREALRQAASFTRSSVGQQAQEAGVAPATPAWIDPPCPLPCSTSPASNSPPPTRTPPSPR
ncbi:hypothetical protein JMJ55_09855 [Belnapia sp. T6]|uniref:Uncharacterized protein n=1 Tax=Belnapia mucosa TaxID=2804532 RepID=A0ABS1V1Q0_9PROT|nr:hypothetical protein [Belnapia mucosa]MBL6455627.1 hypothetical protein [Belnapia mucosa]